VERVSLEEAEPPEAEPLERPEMSPGEVRGFAIGVVGIVGVGIVVVGIVGVNEVPGVVDLTGVVGTMVGEENVPRFTGTGVLRIVGVPMTLEVPMTLGVPRPGPVLTELAGTGVVRMIGRAKLGTGWVTWLAGVVRMIGRAKVGTGRGAPARIGAAERDPVVPELVRKPGGIGKLGVTGKGCAWGGAWGGTCCASTRNGNNKNVVTSRLIVLP